MPRVATQGEAPLTRPLRAACLIAAFFIPGFVYADSIDYSALEALFGEPVTASATGSPQRESQVPATMIIVTAEEIRRSGARDIPGVLQHVAGVDVMQTSNDHAEVNVRGFNQAFSPRLLVLVDGRQVYADYYGFTPWSTVPVELDAIRQIEVVKGPNSALFGFNAVGGVINIVTYDALFDDAAAVSVSGGTQGLRQASVVSHWKAGESLGFGLSAGHREGDDFSTPLRPADVGARRGNERSSVDIDLEWNATETLHLGAEATYTEVRQAEFTPVYSLSFGEYKTKSIKAFAIADTKAGLLRATVYSNHIETDSFEGAAPEPSFTFDNRVTVAQLQSISKIASEHTLRLTAEYRHNSMATMPFPGGDVFYDVAAIGSMWEWRIDPAVTTTVAVRLDRWSLGRSGDAPATYPLSNDDWDRARTEPSFNAGVVWQASDVDTLRFLVGRGVQLPNLFNLGGFLLPIPPIGFVTGLPDLDPTIVETYEVAWDRLLSSFAARLRVSVFHGQSRDIVAILGETRLSEGLLSIPFNVGDSRTDGMEVSLQGTLREDWRWGWSYKAQRIEDQFDAGMPVERTLTDFEHTTPRHVLKANLGWARDRWEVDGFLRYQSGFQGILSDGQGTGTGLLVSIPSHVAVDGRIGYAINDRIVLALSGQNLGRSEQRQTSAPEVERRLFATFSVYLGPRE